MSKKITMSVPDNIYKSMQRWKDQVNFSGVFQDAISKEIKTKEEYQAFKNTFLAKIDTKKVINNLRKEKKKICKEHYCDGKKDGFEHALTLDYEGFQYAFQFVTAKEFKKKNSGLRNYDPTRDEYFGGYFEKAMAEEDFLSWEKIGKGKGIEIPSELYCEWEAGFIEGIKDFWEKIKDKL